MKNIFLSFLILSFSPIAWGDEDASCAPSPLTFAPEALVKTACTVDKKPELINLDPKKQVSNICACLKDELKGHALLSSLHETVKKPDDQDLKKYKEELSQKFFSMYEKVTIGASVQAKVLGIEDDLGIDDSKKPKIVGCTPSDISNQVRTKALKSLELQTEDLEEKQAINNAKIANCTDSTNPECVEYKSIGERIEQNIKNAKTDVRCEAALKMFVDGLGESYKLFSDIDKSYPQLSIKDVISDYHNKGIVPLDVIHPGFKKNFKKGKINCSDVYKIVTHLNKKIQRKEEEKIKDLGGEVARKPKSKCANDDSLCIEFENKNKALIESTAEKYQEDPDECITLAEFETFKAMPSPSLLDALAESSDPKQLLDLKSSSEDNTDIQKATKNFLRSNPIIAKMVTSEPIREELAKKLQAVANVLNKEQDPGKRYKAYLDFMKKDVRDLHKRDLAESKQTDSFVCSEVAASFTAIEIANDIPLPKVDTQNMTQIQILESQYNRCNHLDYKASSTTDIEATLNNNKIFNIGVNDNETKDEAKEFSDLKASLCAEYPAYVANECEETSDNDCRMNYLKRERASKKMAKNLAAFNFIDATVEAIQSKSIKANLDNNDIKDVSRITDESQQDHKYKDWWNENVGSKMDQNVMARSGHYEEFEKSRRQNESIAFSTKAPQSLFSPIDPVVSQNSNASADNVSLPGQQVPEYAKEIPSFDPSKLAKATSPKDLIPNYESLAPFKQKESLTQVKEYIASKPNSPISEESVDEEISSVNKKIAANIKNIENKLEKITNSKPAIASPNMTNVSRSASNIPAQNNVASFSQPFANSSPNSRGGSAANLNTKSQSAQATNKALIQANESRVAETNVQNEGRGPASLLVQETINFQKGVFDPALLQPGLLVNEEILVPDSHDKYEKIKTNLNDLKAFLSEQIDPKAFKEPKIYRIKDPKESPNSYILFYVSKGASGEINVKTVDRKSTLRDLKNTL